MAEKEASMRVLEAVMRRCGLKKKKKNCMIKCLHEDILGNIFLRLSAQSIHSLRHVCTLWRTIVDDPRFIKAYLHALKARLVFHVPGNGDEPINMLTLQMKRERNLMSLLHDHLGWTTRKHTASQIRATCDGMILLQTEETEESLLIIINLVTGKLLRLPRFASAVEELEWGNRDGFALDNSSRGECKLVPLFWMGIMCHGCMISTICSHAWREMMLKGLSNLSTDFLLAHVDSVVWWDSFVKL